MLMKGCSSGSKAQPASKALQERKGWGGLCTAEKNIEFTCFLQIQQIIKSADMVVVDKDLRDATSTSCGTSKGALRAGIAFEAPFLEGHPFAPEELLGLGAGSAAPPGPNHDLGIGWLSHGFRFPPWVSILGFGARTPPLGSLGRSARRCPMLPDTVHKLPREERFAYARLLAFMARIANELTIDEMAMFEQRLGTALLSPNQREMIRAALKNPPTLEECLADLRGEAGRLALRDAVMMAAADGTVDEDERDALEDISEHLGLREEAVDELLQWTIKGYKWMKEGYELLDTLEE